jgi:hypothetical protein
MGNGSVRDRESEALVWPPVEHALTAQLPARREESPSDSEVSAADQAVVPAGRAAVPLPVSVYTAAASRLKAEWWRSRVAPIAAVVFAVAALLEGAFIVRASVRRPSTVGSAPTVQVPPPVPIVDEESAAAPPPTVKPKDESVGPQSSGSAAGMESTHRGRLVVQSEPSGAVVSIDGRTVGVTPTTLTLSAPGEYRVVLKRDGTEVKQTVRVEEGATVSVLAPLQSSGAGSGWVSIVSPIELDIVEDGAIVGTSRSPQIMLPLGPHNLQFVNEPLGFRHTQTVRIEARKVESVRVNLPQSPVHLNALPWAEVWIDGKSAGETPIGNLPLTIGPHEVVFRHPQLGEKKISTVVKAGAPTRVTADLRQ